MSGIAGVIGESTDRAVTERMLLTMKRRGRGIYACTEGSDYCLMYRGGDEESLKQLVNCHWDDEHYTIVYDGHLYNKVEIYRDLIRLGHPFATCSDEEVVLRAYIQWGRGALDKLNGVFAFGIWHEKAHMLFVARDRIGAKPLFYRISNNVFIFGSEIKTILAHPDVPAEIDSYGVAQLLLLGPGKISGSGIFKDIYELKPGCFGEFSEGKWLQKQYWALKDREHTESFEETSDHVRYLLLDAIGRQMDYEKPVGTFLSGGLDSSIITSVCSDICSNLGRQLYTFSVDYDDHEKYFVANKFQPESDRYYIELMRMQISSVHRDVILSSDDLINCLDEATLARGLPGMGDVDFSLFAFCQCVQQDVPIVFSGECADEIFGGYPWYRDPEIRATEGFPWAQNTTYRAAFMRNEHLKDISPDSFVMDLYQTTIKNSDILPGTSRLERRMKELVNLNFQWFMQTLLDRNDRMSMVHNLDVRVPYCDYRIAEYLYAVPWELKDYGGREKGLLRHAMRDVLQESVLLRKKSPYPKTYDPRYTQRVCQMLSDIIADPQSPVLQIVRKDALENLLKADFTRPWYGQLMKLPQTVAYMLQINRWMELYHVSVV